MSDDSQGAGDAAVTLGQLVITGIVLTVVSLLALGASQYTGVIAAVGIGALIVLCAAAVGAALGFVFALPRVLAKDVKEDSSAPATAADAQRQRLLGSNTNFERVSDWLTTIIVGLGLTQLGEIDGALYRFRIFLAETVRVFPSPQGGNAGSLPTVGPMLLILGLVAGFIAVYLFTRLKLSALFHRVEKELLPTATATAVRAVAFEAVTAGGVVAETPAIQAVLSTSTPSVEQGLSLMYSLLYRPGGYQQVINLSAQLSNTAATKWGDYWFYLAAAFGQKYTVRRAESAPAEELESIRQNVLDCARRAVQIDPTFKARLWAITDPEGVDNDLAAFRDDAEFRAIVPSRVRRN